MTVEPDDTPKERRVSRRSLLEWTWVLLAAFGVRPGFAESAGKSAAPLASRRGERAYRLRVEEARRQLRGPVPRSVSNGDEERYPSRIGNFTKGLVHDALGRVKPEHYDVLSAVLETGDVEALDRLSIGVFRTDYRNLANPQAAFAYVLEGADPHLVETPPPPAFASEELAAEAVELYWQALLRDVPFEQYGAEGEVARAASELTGLGSYGGPRFEGAVTPETLFRMTMPGTQTGPFVSQLLWQEVPYGTVDRDRRIRTAAPGVDFLTRLDSWKRAQDGAAIPPRHLDDPRPRYVRNGRDLAEYVHWDFVYQAYLDAALYLDANVSYDPANPYRRPRHQDGFVTLGSAHVLSLLGRVADGAMKAAWFHKWLVHRRLRPEEFGGRVHLRREGLTDEPVPETVLSAQAVERTASSHGSTLLPQAYPEGCPTHPSYPAAHAVIAGACTTVLKAFFDESVTIWRPKVASDDGLSLEPWTGADLTVGGELDKLAMNIAVGRSFAGIHWRSDNTSGLELGQEIAARLLAEDRRCLAERFGELSFTRFDGSRATV